MRSVNSKRNQLRKPLVVVTQNDLIRHKQSAGNHKTPIFQKKAKTLYIPPLGKPSSSRSSRNGTLNNTQGKKNVTKKIVRSLHLTSTPRPQSPQSHCHHLDIHPLTNNTWHGNIYLSFTFQQNREMYLSNIQSSSKRKWKTIISIFFLLRRLCRKEEANTTNYTLIIENS